VRDPASHEHVKAPGDSKAAEPQERKLPGSGGWRLLTTGRPDCPPDESRRSVVVDLLATAVVDLLLNEAAKTSREVQR
jgi:hypothetical protein